MPTPITTDLSTCSDCCTGANAQCVNGCPCGQGRCWLLPKQYQFNFKDTMNNDGISPCPGYSPVTIVMTNIPGTCSWRSPVGWELHWEAEGASGCGWVLTHSAGGYAFRCDRRNSLGWSSGCFHCAQERFSGDLGGINLICYAKDFPCGLPHGYDPNAIINFFIQPSARCGSPAPSSCRTYPRRWTMSTAMEDGDGVIITESGGPYTDGQIACASRTPCYTGGPTIGCRDLSGDWVLEYTDFGRGSFGWTSTKDPSGVGYCSAQWLLVPGSLVYDPCANIRGGFALYGSWGSFGKGGGPIGYTNNSPINCMGSNTLECLVTLRTACTRDGGTHGPIEDPGGGGFYCSHDPYQNCSECCPYQYDHAMPVRCNGAPRFITISPG